MSSQFSSFSLKRSLQTKIYEIFTIMLSHTSLGTFGIGRFYHQKNCWKPSNWLDNMTCLYIVFLSQLRWWSKLSGRFRNLSVNRTFSSNKIRVMQLSKSMEELAVKEKKEEGSVSELPRSVSTVSAVTLRSLASGMSHYYYFLRHRSLRCGLSRTLSWTLDHNFGSPVINQHQFLSLLTLTVCSQFQFVENTQVLYYDNVRNFIHPSYSLILYAFKFMLGLT